MLDAASYPFASKSNVFFLLKKVKMYPAVRQDEALLEQDEGDGQADDERFDVQEEDSVDVEVYASATDPEVTLSHPKRSRLRPLMKMGGC